MSNDRRILHAWLVALIIIAIPTFTSLAQEASAEELQVQITQVDTSNFPAVTVYISVTDADGEPFGVEPERLLLQEDGIAIHPEQMRGLMEVVETLTTILVFDVSGSMNGADKLGTAKLAAGAYVEKMRPGDQVGLMTFNTAVTYVQPITSNQAALMAAIDGLVAEGDTAMYDALVEAVDLFAIVPGRKAIIALTDGMDNRSINTLEDIIAHIGPSGLSISTVGLGDLTKREDTMVGLDVSSLDSLATQAGGEYAYANDPDGLISLYERYARVLQSEYVVTYVTPSGLRDGLTRHLTVELVDIETTANKAAYNPGGLVPEVGDPASWPVFLGILSGLIILLIIPSVIGRGLALLSGGRIGGIGKPKPRIRFKD